jgi:spore coat protein U-like protein
LGTGQNAVGTQRKLKGTTAAATDKLVNYGLYLDSGRTKNWGEVNTTSTEIDGKAALGDGTAQPYTVYGRVPKSQATPTGAYSDKVLITVSY